MKRQELINSEGYQIESIKSQVYDALIDYNDDNKAIAKYLKISVRKLKRILKGKRYTLTVDLMVKVSLLTGHLIGMIKK